MHKKSCKISLHILKIKSILSEGIYFFVKKSRERENFIFKMLKGLKLKSKVDPSDSKGVEESSREDSNRQDQGGKSKIGVILFLSERKLILILRCIKLTQALWSISIFSIYFAFLVEKWMKSYSKEPIEAEPAKDVEEGDLVK